MGRSDIPGVSISPSSFLKSRKVPPGRKPLQTRAEILPADVFLTLERFVINDKETTISAIFGCFFPHSFAIFVKGRRGHLREEGESKRAWNQILELRKSMVPPKFGI
jgi:hypothetical protein